MQQSQWDTLNKHGTDRHDAKALQIPLFILVQLKVFRSYEQRSSLAPSQSVEPYFSLKSRRLQSSKDGKKNRPSLQ